MPLYGRGDNQDALQGAGEVLGLGVAEGMFLVGRAAASAQKAPTAATRLTTDSAALENRSTDPVSR
jgi:hypothetical protein